jgi:hypothetical protein
MDENDTVIMEALFDIRVGVYTILGWIEGEDEEEEEADDE